jgi:hypothetical protein
MRYLDYWDILVVMPLLLTSSFIMVFVLGYIVFNIVDKH